LERIKRYRRSIKSDSLSLERISIKLSESNSNADFFPFYERGTVTAMMLDLEIRKQSRGKQSLETALLELNRSYGKAKKPYPEEQLIEVLEFITQTKLKDFAKRYISSVEELPFEELFRSAGYKLFDEKREVPNLGFLTEQSGNGHHAVTFVVPDSPAEKTGLMAEDEIIEANGEKEYDKIHQTLFKEGVLKVDEDLSLIIKRNERRMRLLINVKTRTIKNERIVIDSSATQEANR
jgi:predicted metalloprotease with PDZ domain